MSDFMPDPNRLDPNKGHDRYGTAINDPVTAPARGPYILLGILVAIALIGGMLYFNGAPNRNDSAQLPDRTLSAPAPAPALPRVTEPAPAAPAPATRQQ